MVLFRCLQHMNEIYKICVLICFHKSDVIKLTLFSFTWGYQCNVGLNISRRYFSYCSLEYLFCECSLKKRNILNSPFPKVFLAFKLLILRLTDVLSINSNYVTNPCFPFSSLSNVLFVTCRANDHVYQIATLAGHIFFKVKYIPCCFESRKTAFLNVITTSTRGFSALFYLSKLLELKVFLD